MSHVDEGALHAYLDGALDEYPAAEAETIRAHLDRCAECAARLDVERAVRADAHAMLGLAAPEVDVPSFEELRTYVERTRPKRPAATRLYRLGWAASVMLAIGAGWMLRDGQLQMTGTLERDAEEPILARSAVERQLADSQGRVGTEPLAEPTALPSPSIVADGAEPDARGATPSVAQPTPPDAVEAVDESREETAALLAETPAEAVDRAVAEVPMTDPGLADAAGKVSPSPVLDALDFDSAAPSSATAAADASDVAAVFEAMRAAERDSSVSGGGAATGVEAGAAEPEPEAAARARAPSPTAETSALSRTPLPGVPTVGDVDRPLAVEPLLSVPGFEVIEVTNLGDGTTLQGARVLQRLIGEMTFEVFHLEPGVDPSILPPLEAEQNEARTEAETGWVLVRGRLAEEDLEIILWQLFPEVR